MVHRPYPHITETAVKRRVARTMRGGDENDNVLRYAMKGSFEIISINKDKSLKSKYKLQPIQNISKVKELRLKTGASYYYCRVALQETDWDIDKSYKWLIDNYTICKG